MTARETGREVTTREKNQGLKRKKFRRCIGRKGNKFATSPLAGTIRGKKWGAEVLDGKLDLGSSTERDNQHLGKVSRSVLSRAPERSGHGSRRSD